MTTFQRRHVPCVVHLDDASSVSAGSFGLVGCILGHAVIQGQGTAFSFLIGSLFLFLFLIHICKYKYIHIYMYTNTYFSFFSSLYILSNRFKKYMKGYTNRGSTMPWHATVVPEVSALGASVLYYLFLCMHPVKALLLFCLIGYK